MSTEPQAAADPNVSKTPAPTPPDPKAEIDRLIEQKVSELSQKRGNPVFPLFLASGYGVGPGIGSDLVDDVFDDLRQKYSTPNPRLDVILHSSGGDIHSAYNVGLLLRRYATELNFIIPRWAKSAATLLACAGNKIFITPVGELGPIDPQITQFSPLESRYEQFSPLHIEATLELIRSEFKGGEERLAKGLLERLQFPLTLGGFKKSLNIGKEYLQRLLATGMFKGQNATEKINNIAKSLVEDYVDHGFCIEIGEAKKIGLEIEELQGDDLRLVWDIFRLNKKKEKLEKEQKEKEMQEILRRLPSGLRLTPRAHPEENGRTNCSIRDPFMRGDDMDVGTKPSTVGDVDKIELAVSLAKEALKERGEITVDHIRAIPFLTSEREVRLVVDRLLRQCNAEIDQRKTASDPFLRWEQFIRLKKA